MRNKLIGEDLNVEFVNAENSNAVETSNSPAVDLSSDTQRISHVRSDPTPKVKIVGDKSAKLDMTLKEIEPVGELDINKSADSDGSSGEQSPRATVVPLACISSTKKSTKTYLKSKEKMKSVGVESAEAIQVAKTAKEPEVDVSVASQISPPSKCPSPLMPKLLESQLLARNP
ncbi:uncharacterized protein LOC130749162 [Lotus japonicus]|uniref:uncharacterized protein LOC130749162 n=1 Tax=Lotus japonicus TaxID=34305 RepID=UPI00259066BA|nr:uncharacterized protein LOC130749162 [Lotus japonicus]